MKELENVMTIRLTAIEKMTDEELAHYMAQKEKFTKDYLDELKSALDVDSIELLNDQDFIRDE